MVGEVLMLMETVAGEILQTSCEVDGARIMVARL